MSCLILKRGTKPLIPIMPRGGLSTWGYNVRKINDLWLPRISLLYQQNVPSSIITKGYNSTAKASYLGRDAHEATTPLVLCLCAPKEFGNRSVICPACMGHSDENPIVGNGHFSSNAGQRLRDHIPHRDDHCVWEQ